MMKWKFEVTAEVGEYGSENWLFVIKDESGNIKFKGQDFPCTVLADAIKNKDEFYQHKSAKRGEYHLYPEVTKRDLAELWIRVVEWAQETNVPIKGFVGNIRPIEMKLLDKLLIPKETNYPSYVDILSSEDGEIPMSGNLWVGEYDSSGKNYGDTGFVFHLSTYDAKAAGFASERTVYLNLDPKIHKEEILEVFENAEVVHLPNSTFYANIRSILFD